MADNLLDKASILLTPTAYNVGSMLSIKPTSGDGDFTFLRNGDASRVNSSGNIVIEGANLPRINYENGCGSYILEPQSTNIYLNSEILSTQNNTTLASTYTVSFYGTGTITFSGTHTGSLVGTSLTDRVSATFTATAGTLTSTVTGTVTKGQLEQQFYATSYIPTLGALSTRLQDVAKDSGNSTLINSSEGILYANIAPLGVYSSKRAISLNGGNDSDRLFIRYTTNNQLQVIFRAGSVNVVNQLITLSNPLDFNQIAVSYKLNEFIIVVNGVQIGSTITSGTAFGTTVNSIDFEEYNGLNKFRGKVLLLAYYDNAAETIAQLTSLTTI